MADPNRPPPVTGYPAPPPQNGTAYPYPAAQQTYFNTSYYPPNNPYTLQQQQERIKFLRRIFAIFMGCIIITGIIVFLMWVILRPQVPEFRVNSLSVSNFNASSNSLVSGNWDAQLMVRNPNSKITLYYDQIEAAVFYKAESIAETTVAPFVQGKKNETAFGAKFASVSSYVNDKNGIANDRIKGNAVAFNIRMVARVRFKAGSWWAKRRVLRVYCPDLNVAFSTNATSSGSLTAAGVKNCRVGL
uniref:NDR1/HIN1-like protein 1 n=1 Tax=Erigeron canadensis TaxID=72917 RepID=UPI001CB8DA98|nr:NDR1/HIN1-like protein 1 [Erigeron canadensis]XP_043632885.1 NDR1/HIN1-like protein 1 [Erigeron canadensis]XP_043632886.1 NDR1/HIN1-like protein 1 [Erigeron canadensis]XP_043632887.1 NDR1/HIN1-like protein 1 [Erigeron canadensis]